MPSHVELLESRISPASISFSSGILTFTGGAATATSVGIGFSGVNYSIITGGAETISLSASAIAAGFIGGGTNTVLAPNIAVTGIVVSLGDQNDSLGLVALSDPITVTDGLGTDSIAINGALTPTGLVDLAAEGISVNAPISGATEIVLTGNAVGIAANLTASQRVTVQPLAAGRTVNLGTEVVGQTSLTDAEVDHVNAPVFRVGSPGGGDVLVSAAISPALTPVLILRSGDTISDSAAGSLLVAEVGADAGSGIFLTNPVSSFSNVEARTVTGGIRISRSGALTIGDVTADLPGLSVTTSGDIEVSSFGTLTLADTDGIESIHGATSFGDVRLTALGVSANITSSVNQDSINAPAGSIFLTAGRDISFGTGGPSFDNDVRAGRDITINAGRDVVVDGFADLAANDMGLGGGDFIINAGRNITVTNANGNDGSIGVTGTGSGPLQLRTGASGQVALQTGASNTVFANSGGVTIHTDRLIIAPGSSIVTLGSSVVTIRPATPSLPIVLGSASDAAVALEVSAAEVSAINSSILSIGAATDNGGISIIAPITRAGGTLSLLTGGTIADGSVGEVTLITASNLRLQSGLGIGSGNALEIATGTLAFTNNGTLNIWNTGPVSIGPVDGVGVSFNNGDLTLVATGHLAIASPLNGSAGSMTLSATGISQTAAVTQSAGAGFVLLIGGGESIVLNHTDNNFRGALFVQDTGGQPARIFDANDLLIGPQVIDVLFELGAAGTVTQMAGFTGAGVLRFTGPGTFIMDAPNSNTGITEVTGGTLSVTGSILESEVFVGEGGTLEGFGSVSKAIVVRPGGRIAPGADFGVLSAGSGVTFQTGSVQHVQLNGLAPGVTYDQLSVAGTVDLQGATLTGSIGFVPADGDEFIIITNDGADAVLGDFLGVPEGGSAIVDGHLFRVSYRGGDGNDVTLTFTEESGKSLVIPDSDGDVITVKTTAGTLGADNFVMVETPAGLQIGRIVLGPEFKGANLTITAKRSAFGGNGLVNIGFLDATGVDLGAVTISGDLGQIDAGDGDPQFPALKSLKVQSLGALGLSTQGPCGSLQSDLAGSVGKLTVKTDVKSSSFLIFGAASTLGTATIGGSFVGATLQADAGMGNLKILGRVVGGTILANEGRLGTISIGGSISDGAVIQASLGAIKSINIGGHASAGVEIHAGTTLGAINVKGEIAGTEAEPVIISAVGQAVPPTKSVDLAIKSLSVRGRVENLRLLAGYEPGGIGFNADASIGLIKVGGDWVASTVLAGVGPGEDGFDGTGDDAKFTGMIRDNASLFAQIGSIIIRGQALGTVASADSFGVVSERIVKAQIAGANLPLTNGANNATDAFAAAPTGLGATGLLSDFHIREVVL